ncbi:MAG: hypothetical protein ACOCV2_03740 [Persicimonas sp.]
MASRELTREQGLLLQRYHDGELSAAESVQAEQLLERERAARIYVRALEELRAAVEAADQQAWHNAREEAPTPDELVRLALEADDLCDEPLEDLAPLLERFHDGEADRAEMMVVQALVDERDDVAAYLANLEGLNQGLKAASAELTEGVDFDAMWRGIEAGIDAHDRDESPEDAPRDADADRTAFDPHRDLPLLYRYFDGEANEDEAARVEQWLASDDSEARAYVAALDEIKEGVSLAVEQVVDEAPVDQIASRVSEKLSDQSDQSDGSVVSIQSAREDRDQSGGSSGGDTQRGWWHDYRQAIVGGVAAAVVLVAAAALFQDQLFGPEERVVVEERVVFVDDVESSPGSSVKIDGPTKKAGMNGDVPDEAEGADEDDSTVIWLMDSEDGEEGAEDGPRGRHKVAPGDKDDEPDAGNEDEDDAGSMPHGKPI